MVQKLKEIQKGITYSNSKKLRDHLNWQPQVKLDSGLKEMISYRKKFSI